jgi:hypothetical protein
MSAEVFWYIVRAFVIGAILGIPSGYLIAFFLEIIP